jgi:hypothetical protein
MKRKSEIDRKLADRAYLLRYWRAWHREQLEEALAGVHRDVLARLLGELKNLKSARALVDLVAAQDWSRVDPEVRAIALHEVNRAITQLRERAGLTPFDDGPPDTPLNAFRSKHH